MNLGLLGGLGEALAVRRRLLLDRHRLAPVPAAGTNLL